MQGDFGTLKEGADRNGERLAAFLTLVEALAVRLSLHLRDAVLIDVTAMRAIGAFGPTNTFKVGAGCVLIVVGRIYYVSHEDYSTPFALRSLRDAYGSNGVPVARDSALRIRRRRCSSNS